MASTSKQMESPEGVVPFPSFEPPWLLPYLAKMKEEIKKEVIEELLGVCDKAGAEIPKSNTKRGADKINEEVVHEGIFCDSCDVLIRGIRYKCGNCTDFDLCQECENIPNIHNKNHIFLKIRYSVPLKLKQKRRREEVSIHEIAHNLATVSEASSMSKDCVIRAAIRRPKNVGKTYRLFEAKFVKDETVPDDAVLAPHTKFVKSWRVVNSGTRTWTKDTKLHYLWGTKDLIPAAYEVAVPYIKPGEEGVVSVSFTAPAFPGTYQSHWQFCHKNLSFGHWLWCNIKVQIVNPEEKQQPLAVNNILKKTNDTPGIEILCEKENENQRNEVSSIAQVLTAVQEEHERGNIAPRKLVVTSHTATPNNTPFDLTPPKSPEPQECAVKELQEAIADSKSNHDSECDDEGSILSLSSCESDTEFVVIPMPKCFNMSESFASCHFPQFSQHIWSSSAPNDNITPKKDTGNAGKDAQQCKQHSALKRSPALSETVSQETGVPEVSENITVEATVEVFESDTAANEKKVLVSRLSVDGSSSEISIIESDDNSPSVEALPPAMESMSITVSNKSEGEQAVSCKISYPLPDQFDVDSADVSDQGQDSSDIPCNVTFPKFPVEGIDADLPIPRLEERTVQVLPEGLLTGALSAAATVYNTAKAVISSIQHPRNEQEACLSREFVATDVRQNEVVSASIPHPRDLDPMDQLVEMGFCNRQLNEQYLRANKGDLALVVSDLVDLNDNDWYASRHNPTSTNFD